MMHGIDVSNWQSGLIPSNLSIDFCIAKATEGMGYTDPCCDGFIQNCLENGILWGFYHFARENDPAAEAEYFVQETYNYFGNGIPVLDYETANWNNREWCELFMSKVHELTGIWPVLYISAYMVPEFADSWIPQTCGLWLAGYPYPAESWTNDKMPYSIGEWEFCAIWQFTSSLQLPGYSGNLDGNIAYMDADAWLKYAGAPWQDIEPLPDPKPEPNPSPTKSIDDLAVETILGEYGTGAERQRLLGSNYNDVQERVNQYYNRARECIRGDWGNGWNRTNALTGAGYNADIVQRIVNEMMS